MASEKRELHDNYNQVPWIRPRTEASENSSRGSHLKIQKPFRVYSKARERLESTAIHPRYLGLYAFHDYGGLDYGSRPYNSKSMRSRMCRGVIAIRVPAGLVTCVVVIVEAT